MFCLKCIVFGSLENVINLTFYFLQLESLRQEVGSQELYEDMNAAKSAVEKHKLLQGRIQSPSLHDLHSMGHRLLQRWGN